MLEVLFVLKPFVAVIVLGESHAFFKCGLGKLYKKLKAESQKNSKTA